MKKRNSRKDSIEGIKRSSLPEPASSPPCVLHPSLHPAAPPVCTAAPSYLLQSPVSCLLRQSRASALLLATPLSLPHLQKKSAYQTKSASSSSFAFAAEIND
ncbi:hypothetical protein SLEP1_g51544 [Rubroshorea leprosula]|uniref:Uncharacterized protein n=1 Tax=Rubroshorea leprosula TaxID=152421 RepID=A0AAV5M3K7_9ROSI|nr:hypothetical protein SLEP1_g51544 [Rubroshorea leprosula]